MNGTVISTTLDQSGNYYVEMQDDETPFSVTFKDTGSGFALEDMEYHGNGTIVVDCHDDNLYYFDEHGKCVARRTRTDTAIDGKIFSHWQWEPTVAMFEGLEKITTTGRKTWVCSYCGGECLNSLMLCPFCLGGVNPHVASKCWWCGVPYVDGEKCKFCGGRL